MKLPFRAGFRPKISFNDLPRRASLLHRMRPDVHQAFDVRTERGRAGLYAWYFLHAFHEMWFDFDPDEDCKGPVNAPVPRLPVRHAIPLTWLMVRLWRQGLVPGHAVLRQPFGAMARFRIFRRGDVPKSREQQRALLAWYFCCGLQELNLLALVTQDQVTHLLAPAPGTAVPLVLELAHAMAGDMHGAYPDPSRDDWRQWCAVEGRRRFRILDRSDIRKALFAEDAAIRTPAAASGRRASGVNVIGHVMGRSGVGEDVRMAARALEAAGIPFSLHDVRPSSGIPSEEAVLAQQVSTELPYAINLFCMAGMEAVTMFGGKPELLEGRVNIGFWPWELERWPDLWSHAPRLMDELWASTRFTAEAYRRSTDVPVFQMPMAVAVDQSEGLVRRDFGIAEGDFVFCFAFDGQSSFARKNPAGCIAAFRRAFPRGDEPVALVLKGLRVADSPDWQRIVAEARADSRILLLTESLARGALLDLYRAVDCFASLHRSEGFGRNIAECMLLGKPVIASNYSGNIDFTCPGTAALVDVDMTAVGEGEYAFGAGQIWAAPAIDHAAALMRRMFIDDGWRSGLANAGRSFIEANYAPGVVGRKFAARIEAALGADRQKKGTL